MHVFNVELQKPRKLKILSTCPSLPRPSIPSFVIFCDPVEKWPGAQLAAWPRRRGRM